MTVEEFRFTRGDLKRYRNQSAETKLAEAVVQTFAFYGSEAYEQAIGSALKEHSVAASIFLADSEPILVVPLRKVIPLDTHGMSLEEACNAKPSDNRILEGGLLVTADNGVALAWQEFRSGGLGRMGMADACGAFVAYEDIEDAMAGGLVSIQTADASWALIVQQAGNGNQRIWKEKNAITDTVGNTLRQVLDA